MTEQQKGSQIPSQSVILSYFETYGDQAIELYERSGGHLLEWQKALVKHILAINDDELFVHQKFGYAVPRRNGKSESAIAIALWGIHQGLRIMYTAHRTATSTSIWERLCRMLNKSGLEEQKDYTTSKRVGAEKIVLKSTDGEVHFRTRTANGGLGEGYDILIIDEAQEYTTDQESALIYVVSSSANPLTVMLGTPPTVKSGGTVFANYRKSVLSGGSVDSGWAEWSVKEMHDPHDRQYWYQANPSLGYILTERVIQGEIRTGEDLDFNIQRLGYWVKYNIKSAITKEEWLACLHKPARSELVSKVFAGVKYSHDSTNVSLSYALKMADGRVFVECIGCKPIREGDDWIIKYLKAIKPAQVVIDGASGQKLLERELNDLQIAKNQVVLPAVKDIIVANSLFEQSVTKQTICHSGQTSLTMIASNCEHRAIGTNGGFGYQSIKDGLEIAILDSVILAHWSAVNSKERRIQKISY